MEFESEEETMSNPEPLNPLKQISDYEGSTSATVHSLFSSGKQKTMYEINKAMENSTVKMQGTSDYAASCIDNTSSSSEGASPSACDDQTVNSKTSNQTL